MRLDLTLPGFGGGGGATPPPVPGKPAIPLQPDTSRLRSLQRKTGRARGLRSLEGETGTGATTGGSIMSSIMLALKKLTGE